MLLCYCVTLILPYCSSPVYQHQQHPIPLYLQEYQNISQTLLMMLPVLCSDKILIITAVSDLLTGTLDTSAGHSSALDNGVILQSEG